MKQTVLTCRPHEIADKVADANRRGLRVVAIISASAGGSSVTLVCEPTKPPSFNEALREEMEAQGKLVTERADHLHKAPRYIAEVFSGRKCIWRAYLDTDGFAGISQSWPTYASVSQVVVRPVGEVEVEQPLEADPTQPIKQSPYLDLAQRLLAAPAVADALAHQLQVEGL